MMNKITIAFILCFAAPCIAFAYKTQSVEFFDMSSQYNGFEITNSDFISNYKQMVLNSSDKPDGIDAKCASSILPSTDKNSDSVTEYAIGNAYSTECGGDAFIMATDTDGDGIVDVFSISYPVNGGGKTDFIQLAKASLLKTLIGDENFKHKATLAIMAASNPDKKTKISRVVGDYFMFVSNDFVKNYRTIGVAKIMRGTDLLKISDDYKDNELAADDKYKDKLLLVDGEVSSVNEGIGGELYVKIKIPTFIQPQLIFKDEERKKLISLHRGQQIVAKCVGAGTTFGIPQLKDCILR